MQIGIVGLGRMGANIARRLIRAGHQVVGFDAAADAAKAVEGLVVADDLAALVQKLQPPRAVWVMLPAGRITEEAIAALGGMVSPGDVLIDGGNTFYKDDIRRAKALAKRGIDYVDCGTSGGVWGLERGYCMMIGGDGEAVTRLDPVFAALAPGAGTIERTPGREGRDARVEQGYMHCGPAGSGHFVKMIHNGIEYGLMQAYAEGFDILRGKNSPELQEDHRFDLNLPDIAEVWRRGSVVSSWLLDLTASALAHSPNLDEFEGRVADSGEGRWTIDAAVEEAVAAPVLAASLFARFRSRLHRNFGDQMLSAMRHAFGGHVEGVAKPVVEKVMSGISGSLEVVKDAGALAARAADIIAARLTGCEAPFRLALAGGSTPAATYTLLSRRAGLPWSCVELFFGDERFVPPDDPNSNYRMVHDTLLSGGRVQPRKIFAVPTDDTPDSAAARYDEMLRQQYGAGTLEPGAMLFGLTLLGLGEDGHTASLLPDQPVLQERGRWAAAVPKGREQPRITLTYPALESSGLILFLVSGAGKRDALAQARGGRLPAGHLRPQGEVIWLADAAAAGQDDQGYGF